MAIKVQATKATGTEATEATGTDLTAAPVNNALAAFSAINLFNVEPPKPSNNLLPQVKIPYPIEMSDVFGADKLYKVGLFDGSAFTLVQAPYIMTVIGMRECARKLVTPDSGENSYERSYKSMGTGFDASAAAYEQHLTDPEAQKGVSMIVGIIAADGAVTVAELPAFKVLKDYWVKPLHQARAANGCGLRVTIADHSVNLVQAKTGTNKYLAPNKFTQHSIVDLTPEQTGCLAAVLETAKDKFEAWAKQ